MKICDSGLDYDLLGSVFWPDPDWPSLTVIPKPNPN